MSVATEKYQTLCETEWRELSQNHFEIATAFTAGPRLRRDRDEKHPVEDFLFNYYPYPIALLEQWQPGYGTVLEFSDAELLPIHLKNRRYRIDAVSCCLELTLMDEKERLRLQWIVELLEATQRHIPNFACHGLHEWAMVYRAEEIRHASIAPLRLPQAEIDALVSSRPITCTHYDAFRFFANQAKPLNRHPLSIDKRHENEQPGCVHANMDLYKWAAKSMPWIGSDILLETFRLASQLRDLDMRASPYDLTAWNVTPIKIENAEGRREYETEQRRLSFLAIDLRAKLIRAIQKVILP
ncbi:MAG: 3-methyladenine DNA glycosylase [Verrucomicrobiota bacterium]